MKTNFFKRILGCALAALAAGNAVAGQVIGGQLYTPLNINLVATYYTATGQLKKVAITSKEILNVQGYKGDQLARGPGGDIYIIGKNAVVTDLTTSGNLTADLNVLLQTETSQSSGTVALINSAYNYVESGTLTLSFYSNPQFDEGGALDPAASESASKYWFEASGAYSRTGKVSAVRNNLQTVSENFSATLDGDGYDVDLYNINPANTFVPGTCSVSGSGSGQVMAAQ